MKSDENIMIKTVENNMIYAFHSFLVVVFVTIFVYNQIIIFRLWFYLSAFERMLNNKINELNRYPKSEMRFNAHRLRLEQLIGSQSKPVSIV